MVYRRIPCVSFGAHCGSFASLAEMGFHVCYMLSPPMTGA